MDHDERNLNSYYEKFEKLDITVVDKVGRLYEAYCRLRFDSWSHAIIGYDVECKLRKDQPAGGRQGHFGSGKPGELVLLDNQKPPNSRLRRCSEPAQNLKFEGTIERVFQTLAPSRLTKFAGKRGSHG